MEPAGPITTRAVTWSSLAPGAARYCAYHSYREIAACRPEDGAETKEADHQVSGQARFIEANKRQLRAAAYQAAENSAGFSNHSRRRLSSALTRCKGQRLLALIT